MRKYLTASLLLSALFISCATYKTHKFPESVDREFHVDVYTHSAADRLDYAMQFAGEGDYDRAIDLFSQIYENAEIDPVIRQKALLNLGSVYSNVLFAGRDHQKSLDFLGKLLAEFPARGNRSDRKHQKRNTT